MASPISADDVLIDVWDRTNHVLKTSATVSIAPSSGSMTDRSGATTANTSIEVMAANSSRKFLFFQNLSNSVMFINFGAAATNGSPSIQIAPADTWTSDIFFIPTDAMYVWSADNALSFTAKEG